MIRLGIGGEAAAADVGAVIAQSVRDSLAKVRVLASEFGRLGEGKSEQIVHDKNLAVAIRTSTDADRGDAQFAGNARREIARNGFEDDGKGACGFDRSRV